MRAIRTRYGARLVHGGSYLSKILAEPGPTHEVFDVLAAVVTTVAPPGPFAVLGFAGGGFVAPMRALGDRRAVRAVDLDTTAVPLFRSLCGAWCGSVRIKRGDAVAWLAGHERRFSAVLDDLSINEGGDVTKPGVSTDAVPTAAAAALVPGGVMIINAIPVRGIGWNRLNASLAGDHRHASQIRMIGYDNRVLVAGEIPHDGQLFARTLRQALRRIGSRMAPRIRVRTIR